MYELRPASKINLLTTIVLTLIATGLILVAVFSTHFNNLFFIIPAVLLFAAVVMMLKIHLLFSTTTKDIQQMRVQLRDLAAHLQLVREEERKIIAHEIHDELGQQLTGLKMDIFWLNKKLQTPDNIIQAKIDGMLQLVDDAVKSARNISAGLQTDILDDMGLAAALEWQSLQTEKRSEVKVAFHAKPLQMDVPAQVAIGIYRIYQEALTHAVRHANAHVISGALLFEDNCLLLTVKDDGQLIDDVKNCSPTLAQMSIKERTLMLGGKYSIESERGNGSSISISIPL